MNESNNPLTQNQNQPDQSPTQRPITALEDKVQSTKIKRNKSKKLFVAILLLMVLTVCGVVTWTMLSSEKSNNINSSVQTTEESSEELSSDAPKTLEIENRGTYTQIENTGLVTFYDVKLGPGATYESVTIDQSNYVTLNIPTSWEVYEQEIDIDAGLGAMIIATDTGKYIHLSHLYGIGGACETNSEEYTLNKKLPTATDNLFFTQYTVQGDADAPPHLVLESFNYPLDENIESIEYVQKTKKHWSMKEGDTNVDTCMTNIYGFASGHISVMLSDSSASELGGSLSWDDIKDDQAFIDALQSLKVTQGEQ